MSRPGAGLLTADLVVRVEGLLAGAAAGEPGRRLLGITGAPGAGKSTLAAAVCQAFAPRVVVVPMDGFHLAQSELERLGRADRKGAPDTFDAAGFVALLRRLRTPEPDETVWAPQYRRDLRHGVTGAIAVPADVPLVVVEGNYLLSTTHGWGPTADALDLTFFVDVDPVIRRQRLIARHIRFGKSPEAARDWALGPDERNAELIQATAARANSRILL